MPSIVTTMTRPNCWPINSSGPLSHRREPSRRAPRLGKNFYQVASDLGSASNCSLLQTSAVIRRRVVAHGRVQGVFFRDSCRRQASVHGVSGWVTNREDGAVEAVFEGDPAAVQALVEWTRRGPSRATPAAARGSSAPCSHRERSRCVAACSSARRLRRPGGTPCRS